MGTTNASVESHIVRIELSLHPADLAWGKFFARWSRPREAGAPAARSDDCLAQRCSIEVGDRHITAQTQVLQIAFPIAIATASKEVLECDDADSLKPVVAPRLQ